ncbi:MAG TPA: hypothetical protein VNK03_01055 [Gammaproteobacteria bacterium]|nr:hypothetical protein [Gammaproteobacteria bacterium]
MKLGGDSSNVVVTDNCLLMPYLDKKYYLQDPTFDVKPNQDESNWKITLGTDSEAFRKNGFLHDLYKMCNMEEYVSIEKKVSQSIIA